MDLFREEDYGQYRIVLWNELENFYSRRTFLHFKEKWGHIARVEWIKDWQRVTSVKHLKISSAVPFTNRRQILM